VYNIPQAKIDAHKRSGKGRAPGGACGALYAVLELIEDAAQRDVLAARFSEIAGDTLCRAIRREKRISCGGCVEAAAVLLQEIATANNCTKPPSGGGHANGAE
jgi:hypothetical protein